MACYHFTIKADKKPDGTKISASVHVEYIAREGKYKDYEKEETAEQENFRNQLFSDKPIENALKKPTLLYRSPFGSIIRTKNGIRVSDNASVETVAIALAITEKLYGGEIQLNASDAFKAQVLVAANEMDLPLHFVDTALAQKYEKMQKEKNHVRRKFERSGRKFRKPKSISTQPNIKQRTLKAVTKTGFSLPKLSERHMVLHGEKSTLLLSGHDDGDLLLKGSEFYRSVRWDASGARRGIVKKVANDILANVQKHLDSVFAASHVQYINREAAFKQRGDCIYKNHHLPKWANGSAKHFFTMADKYERVNGVRYKEIEFALPNELKLEQQKEIIGQFIENHLKDFYYAYAIHDKIGVMSTGEHNTHVHIMFSERKIDEAEKIQERACNEFFKKAYPNAKNLDDLRRGGAKKDPKWNGENRANYLSIMREDFAKIQNATLEKYDIPDRVDHRSLKVQMEEARASGNMRLAELLDRMPEEHIGPDTALKENHPKVIELQKYRAYKREHQQLLYAAELMENSIAEDITNDVAAISTKAASKITRLEEYKKAQETNFTVLKNDMLTALKEATALNRIVIWNKDAIEIAKLKFMTLEEKELWQGLKNLQEQKDHWTIFKKNFRKPASHQQTALEAYNALLPELDHQIYILDDQIKNTVSKIQPISERLSSPTMQSKIQKETAKILWEDKSTKERLNKANENLNLSIEKLQQEIHKHTNNEETVFTAKRLQEILSASYDNLKMEYDRTREAAQKLESRVISYDRAIAIAKDIYAHGDFKKLREEYRVLEKKEKYLTTDKINYQQSEEEFSKISKPKFWQTSQTKTDYENKKQELLQKANQLSYREKMLLSEKSKLDHEQSRLNALCEAPEGKSKIEEIAMGILKKNQPIAEKHKALMEKTKESLQKFNHTKKQLQAVKKQAAVDKNTTQYAVVKHHSSGGGYSPSSAPSIIADAILGDPKAVQLVARIKPGLGEMEKDWDMMTEIEKDEKLNSIENIDRY
ncbi:MAG: hypothetical protein H6Q70_64 [Firmicutes bacterium]|nr:hypothetical protein [Bacillota bacterium]